MPARNPPLIFTPRFAALRLFAGAAMISFSGVFVKLVSVSPIESAFWRVFFGGLILAGWVRLKKHTLFPGRAVLMALLTAALFLALDLAFWHTSIVYIGPGLATLLGNFQVFFMALAGALFFRERLGPRMRIAIPLAILGLTLIVGFDWTALSPDTRLGILFGLLTALVYTGFLLFLRRAQSHESSRDASADLAVVCLLTALMLAVYLIVSGATFSLPGAADLSWLLTYALVSQALGWFLITSALTQVPAARVGLILLSQPALAFVWDIAFFARQFTVLEATGAAIALLAIYLGSRPPPA